MTVSILNNCAKKPQKTPEGAQWNKSFSFDTEQI